MDKIAVYTSNTCPYCLQVKEYLKTKGVEFEERNISTEMKHRKELMSKGIMSVPVITKGDVVITGFDKEKIDELIG